MDRPDLADLATRGVATPDHVIRTKAHPLVLDAATVASGKAAVQAAVAGFVERYKAYFERQAPRFGGAKTLLAPTPGLVWIAGAGVLGVGADAASARIAGDIGQQTIRVMRDAQAAGEFRPIGEADTFDCEYWSLEQAKLGKGTPPAFRGRVVLVTGGAGAIGLATAQAFKALGAALFLVDRDPEALAAGLARLGGDHGGIALDITAPGAAAAGGCRLCAAVRRARHSGGQRRGRHAGRDGNAARRHAAGVVRVELLQPPRLCAGRRGRVPGAGARRADPDECQQAGGEPRQELSVPMACPRQRRCSCYGNSRWNWGPKACG